MTALVKAMPLQNLRVDGRFVLIEACSVVRNERVFQASVRNISRGGMCLEIPKLASSALGIDVEIMIRNFAPISATAKWSHARTFGFEFLSPIEEHQELKTLLDELSATMRPRARLRSIQG